MYILFKLLSVVTILWLFLQEVCRALLGLSIIIDIIWELAIFLLLKLKYFPQIS